ncbi:MAG: hypothetical protein L6R19_24980 [Alphaproteobacteria bacterium]|nr:hypothetical protein [Alphaproteobacteria bacterium]
MTARTSSRKADRTAHTAGRVIAGPPLVPAHLLDEQRRAAELWAALGQRYLEGLRDIASHSFLVQSALYQQSLANLFNLSQAGPAGGPGPHPSWPVASAMEATVGSIRDALAQACKCHVDMMAALQDGAASRTTGTGAAPLRGRR